MGQCCLPVTHAPGLMGKGSRTALRVHRWMAQKRGSQVILAVWFLLPTRSVLIVNSYSRQPISISLDGRLLT